MNNNLNLKFVLEAIDKMTAPTRRMREGFTQNVGKMREKVSELRFAVSYHLYFITKATRAALQAMHEFGDKVEKVGKKISGAGGFFTGRITAPILGFGAVSILAAGQVEQLERRIAKLTGSADTAKKMMAALEGFRVFDMADRSTAMETLMQRGYTPDEALSRMRMLGDLAAGTNNKLTDLVNTYLDLRMKGKADAGALEGMVKAGIPIVTVLAQQLGKTEQQIYQMAAGGGISFKKMREAMRALTMEGGIYANEMQAQAGMITGSWQALVSDFKQSLADFGGDIFTRLGIGEKMREIGRIVRGLAEGFLALPEPLKNFIVYAALLAAALGPILIVLGQLVVGFGLMTMGLAKLPGMLMLAAKAFAFMGEAMIVLGRFMLLNPIGLVITFAVAGYMLIKHWSKVRDFFAGLWTSIKGSFNDAIDWIMSKVENLIALIERMTSGLRSAVKDNPLVQGAVRLFGGNDAGNSTTASTTPAIAGGSRMDTGGTLTIKIDQDGRAVSAEAKSKDTRQDFVVDRGAIMAGY